LRRPGAVVIAGASFTFLLVFLTPLGNWLMGRLNPLFSQGPMTSVLYAFLIGSVVLALLGLAALTGEKAVIRVECPYCRAEQMVDPKQRTLACQLCGREFLMEDGIARPSTSETGRI